MNKEIDYVALMQMESKSLDELLTLKRENRAILEVDIQMLSEKRNSIEADYIKVTDDYLYKTNSISDLTKENNKLKLEVEELLPIKEGLEKKINELEGKLKKLKDVSDELQTATRNLLEKETAIRLKTDILHEVETQYNLKYGSLNNLTHKINQIEPEIDKLKCLIDENNEVLKHIKNIKNNNDKVLADIEVKKNQFIENPYSIGFYATKIKKKTGVDILEYL